MRSDRDNVHQLAAQGALDREGHLAVDLGEQRVILAHADVFAGMHARAALAYDDAAGGNDLLAESLDAQSLGL